MLDSETLAILLALTLDEASSVGLHGGAQVGHSVVERGGCQLRSSNAMFGQLLRAKMDEASLQSLGVANGHTNHGSAS